MKAKNKKNLYSLIIWTMFLFIFFSTSAQAATHYVSTTGSASWANSTNKATPCSLSTANANADAGDVVYLRSGNYNTSLNPVNSGTSGQPITFAAYAGEDAYLNNSRYGINLINGQDWLVLDGFKRNRSGGQLLVAGSSGKNSDYVELKNGHFSANDFQGWSWAYVTAYSHRWHIHNNIFDVVTSRGATNNGHLLRIGGNWWSEPYTSGHYIHDNTFVNGLHHDYMTISHIENSVIKDNTFYNDGSFEDNPCAGDGLQEMLIIYYKARNNLIEGNVFYETGSNIGDGCTMAIHSQNSSGNIFRKNIGYTIDGSFLDGYESDDGTYDYKNNTIYNNTVYNTLNNYDGTEYYMAPIWFIQYNGGVVSHNYVKNNIIHGSVQGAFGVANVNAGTIYNNVFAGNHLHNIKFSKEIYRITSPITLDYAQTNYSTEYFSNLSANIKSVDPNSINPKLTNPEIGQMTLQSDSPCIDKGLWLTVIKSAAGSGRSFTVANPYFFFDGYGISNLTGDVIKTQNGQTTTIQSINYSTGAITVNPAISWTNGEGVALNYQGAKPDIGAVEYLLSEDTTISPPQGLLIIAN